MFTVRLLRITLADSHLFRPLTVSHTNHHTNQSILPAVYETGISTKTGLPFSPPLEFRKVLHKNQRAGERTHIQEGKCHSCNKWIPVQGPKDVTVAIREIFWCVDQYLTIFVDTLLSKCFQRYSILTKMDSIQPPT